MSRRGTVVRASPATFAGLEKAARRQNAKGVYIERGLHTKAAQIQTWLNGQEEDNLMFGEFASAQLLVAPPPCEDSDCNEDHAVAVAVPVAVAEPSADAAPQGPRAARPVPIE